MIINEDGQEVPNKYGKLILYKKDYQCYKSKNKFYLISNHNILEEIEGHDIIILGYNVIIDKVLYELK